MPFCTRCGHELPEAANFCPFCGASVAAAEAKPAQTHQTFKVAGKPTVRVRNHAPGVVEVKRGPDSDVTVDFDIREPEDLDWQMLQEGNVVTVTCRVKILPLHWPRYITSGGPRANILVSVPVETDLDLKVRLDQVSVDGIKGNITIESTVAKVTVRNCEGSVEVKTKTGSVEFENVTGSVSIDDTTGPVDLNNVNGTISVRSTTGSIKYAGALSTGKNSFRTTTGSVSLTLRGEKNLSVEAFARLGKITCSPELTDSRYERGRLTGHIGAGTGRLLIETETGTITIRQ